MHAISRRHLLLGATALSSAILLTSCSSDSQVKKSAEELAQGLQNLDISNLQFSYSEASDAQHALQAKTRNMPGAEPTVTVGEITEEKSSGKAVLHWSWKIPGSPQKWEYTTEASFIPEGENWRPDWNPKILHSSLTDETGLLLQPDAAARGLILGQDDAQIVAQRQVFKVGLDKTKISEEKTAEKSARNLASLLDIDPKDYTEQVKNAGEAQFVEAITLREAAFKELPQDEAEAIEGFLSIEATRPLAPSADFAPDILGSVGPATSEDIERSEGQLFSGQLTGHGGLSQRFDQTLRGTDGYQIFATSMLTDGTFDPDRSQERADQLANVKPVAGTDLRTTLDLKAQEKAVEILRDQESPSAIVALKVSTGEILVAANGQASEGFSTALLSQYAPGSTFKVATSLALIRQGLTPETTVDCSESVEVEGQVFKNASTYPADALGKQPLSVALAQSSNTAFINERDKVSQADLHDAAAALGIGLETDLGVDAFLGTVPTDAQAVEHASSMIGQGKILMSPLSMAVLVASAARGEIVKPVLVKDQDVGETKLPNQTLTRAESDELKKLMRGVVEEGGLRNLQELSPDTAFGKTGTAEYGQEKPPKTHSWVVAVHEDIALALVVEDGDLGSITGAPLALDTFRALQA